eukprot:jgi/Botrbrau1/22204/Bobra.168_1s0035.1
MLQYPKLGPWQRTNWAPNTVLTPPKYMLQFPRGP